MPVIVSSLLDIRSLPQIQLQEFFSLASEIKKQKRAPDHSGKSLALIFFEPSTRTRMSFEMAGHRMGLGTLLFDGGQATSLEKGESIEDSILNIAAMKPELMVLRCGDKVNVAELAKNISCPIINAGWGVQGHPTQALLDAFALKECFGGGNLEGKKLLIVGDVKHSRVASSHFELAEKLGYQIGVCAPEELLIENKQVKTFTSLAEGLRWADAVMALRMQFERHDLKATLSKEHYRKEFGLNPEVLKNLSAKGLILHPGPINHGIEFESEVLKDSRCQVLNQVTHGVIMREAIMRQMLGETAGDKK